MKSLALITKELIGLEYKLGKMDCFSLIVNYLKIIGVDVPDSFKDWDMTNYMELYLDNPIEAKSIMVEFIELLLDEIPVHKSFAGDVLLMGHKTTMPFLAIDGGNGIIIAASVERGVSPSSKKLYNTIRCFRCPKS